MRTAVKIHSSRPPFLVRVSIILVLCLALGVIGLAIAGLCGLLKP